ncbi:hypothetical protein DIPPA_15984 [Diplonema papillatum]|nr:hypothetical protein DIPPA_15984 [Diplonema papillatum]
MQTDDDERQPLLSRRRDVNEKPACCSLVVLDTACYGSYGGGLRSAAEMLPVDCWVRILSFLVQPTSSAEQPLSIEDRQQVLRVAHIDSFLRGLVVQLVTRGWRSTMELFDQKTMLCIATHDSDQDHAELAEHCLLHPVRAAASENLKAAAREAGSSAFVVLVNTARCVYISLFFPTSVTLLGLMHPTWKLWTMSVFAVFFLPLFFLGWLSAKATVDWWIATNPVSRCPHVCRSTLAHRLHPFPWIRVLAILAGTVLIACFIALVAWLFGDWLDQQPEQKTQWILLLIVLVCYCP